MKTILTALILVSGLSVTAAHAGTAIAGGKATTANCALLSGDTPLNTSKGVLASIACTEATNNISFGTCHPSGSRAEKTVQCARTGGAIGNNPTFNDSTCTAANYQTTSFKLIDYKGFVVGNQGGSVGATALGGNCTGGKLDGIVK